MESTKIDFKTNSSVKSITNQVLNKTVPRAYYLRIDEMSDTLVLGFTSILMIANKATNFVTEQLYPRKDLFRKEIKKAAQMIYNPDGLTINKNATSMGIPYLGHAERIRLSIKYNSSDEHYKQIQNIAKSEERRTAIDSVKIFNSASMITMKEQFKEKNIFAKALALLMECHMVNIILTDTKNISYGNKFYICKDDSLETERRRAYQLQSEDIVSIIRCLERIFVALATSKVFTVKETPEIKIASKNFLHKLINSQGVYDDAMNYLGLDLHLTSCVQSSPEYQMEKKLSAREANLEKIQHAIEVKELIRKRDSMETYIKESAESAGWKVSGL